MAAAFPALALTADEWSPGFHDATLDGWLLTAAYLLTALTCTLVARERRPRDAPASRILLVLAAGLLLLGINKQLDLQSLLRFAGRDLAQALGIYEHKTLIRSAVLGLAGAVAALLALWFRRHLVPFFRTRKLLAAGLALLAAFIALSALDVAQQHALARLGLPRGDWHRILEAAALALMALGTARKQPTPPTPPSA